MAVLALVAGTAQGQETARVEVGDFFFCERGTPPETCVTTVSPGDTVVWDYSEGTAGHTVTHCGDSCDEPTAEPLFDSGGIGPGETFSVTFQQPGTYVYRCDFHPDPMRATIVVQAAETPTSTAAPTATSAPAPTNTPAPARPTPTATSAAPSPTPVADDGDSSDEGDGVSAWWLVLAGVGGAAALVAGALAYVRMRG